MNARSMSPDAVALARRLYSLNDSHSGTRASPSPVHPSLPRPPYCQQMGYLHLPPRSLRRRIHNPRAINYKDRTMVFDGCDYRPIKNIDIEYILGQIMESWNIQDKMERQVQDAYSELAGSVPDGR
jgi:hypothetical protein